MSKLHAHIWHTNEGQIIAIGRPGNQAKHKAVPISNQGHSILPVEIDEHEIKTLHKTHAVDVHQKMLIKRQP